MQVKKIKWNNFGQSYIGNIEAFSFTWTPKKNIIIKYNNLSLGTIRTSHFDTKDNKSILESLQKVKEICDEYIFDIVNTITIDFEDVESYDENSKKIIKCGDFEISYTDKNPNILEVSLKNTLIEKLNRFSLALSSDASSANIAHNTLFDILSKMLINYHVIVV